MTKYEHIFTRMRALISTLTQSQRTPRRYLCDLQKTTFFIHNFVRLFIKCVMLMSSQGLD